MYKRQAHRRADMANILIIEDDPSINEVVCADALASASSNNLNASPELSLIPAFTLKAVGNAV